MGKNIWCQANLQRHCISKIFVTETKEKVYFAEHD